MKVFSALLSCLFLISACTFEYNSGAEEKKKAEQVDAYYDNGQYDSALVLINELIKDHKDNAGYVHVRAQILWRSGDMIGALEDAKKAVKMESDNASFHLTASKLLMDMGRFDEALESVNACLKYDPNHSMGYANKGAIVLLGGGNFKDGLAATYKAIELDETNHVALSNLGYIHMNYDGGSMDSALYLLNKSLEYEPSYNPARSNRAAYYFKNGNNERALEDALTCIETNPYDAMPYRIATNIYIQNEDYDSAIKYGEQALKTVSMPNDLIVANTGVAYFKNGDMDKACETWALLQTKPDVDVSNMILRSGCSE